MLGRSLHECECGLREALSGVHWTSDYCVMYGRLGPTTNAGAYENRGGTPHRPFTTCPLSNIGAHMTYADDGARWLLR